MANSGGPLSLTPNYILPQHKRPNLTQISTLVSIPIIDLMEPSALVVEQISKACEEYGFFQIFNHGIPQELCDRMMAVTTDFFELPPEEKAPFFSTDHTKQVKLFNYFVKDGSQNKVSMWSECFSHPWHPLDDILHLLPQNPPQYRFVFCCLLTLTYSHVLVLQLSFSIYSICFLLIVIINWLQRCCC